MKRTILTALTVITIAFMGYMGCEEGTASVNDLKITFDTSTKAMKMTQKSTQVHYYCSKYSLVKDEKEKTDTLLDYKDFVFYHIDHKKKTIGFHTLNDITAIMNLHSKATKGNDEINQVMKMLGGDYSGAILSVVKGGNKVVAGRNCTQWTISYGKMSNKISADPSLVPPIPQDAYAKASKLKDAVGMMAIPGLGDAFTKIIDETAKIKGIHLETEYTMALGSVTTTTISKATKIEVGSIPAFMFELPKGYRKEDLGKKMLGEFKKKR